MEVLKSEGKTVNLRQGRSATMAITSASKKSKGPTDKERVVLNPPEGEGPRVANGQSREAPNVSKKKLGS